ncbi:MAG: adenylate/guanylate cyclase domain-containing protein [Burkholderiales bacterium]
MIPLDQLQSGRLLDLCNRLPAIDPGVIVATGQAKSGKRTTLMALTRLLAQGGDVTYLIDRIDDLKPFEPLPDRWRSIRVASSAVAWSTAIKQYAIPGSITVIATMSPYNAASAFNVANAWVLAAVETPLIAHDVAYALVEMGISYQSFVNRVRCIWSQLLVPVLCGECRKNVSLPAMDLAYLFPRESPKHELFEECGCAKCDWRGTVGKVAVVDALVLDHDERRALTATLLRDAPLKLRPELHVSMQEHARGLVVRGDIGVLTYRDLIRRNPMLRALNEIEREQALSFRLGRVFERFVSPEVKEKLVDGAPSENLIRGESREITCLFCDIRNFTSRSEMRDPHQLFADLNEFFVVVIDAVLSTGGMLNKFIGDAVMAVFGAPVDQPDHAASAVHCALAIQQGVDALNRSRFKDMPIGVGIGINTGRAAAGCVGTDERMEYTVLGDVVNVAARLEAIANAGEILVGNETREQMHGKFSVRSAGSVKLKGKVHEVQAFRVLGH